VVKSELNAVAQPTAELVSFAEVLLKLVFEFPNKVPGTKP